jgi:DNA-directed RNA polymerase subunit RPC12/RpoP
MMSIEFHCSHCGKMVRAPDDAGGKRGKCPSCHQTVYIPMPSDQVQPLDLQPVDESAEQERDRLLKQTRDLQRRVLHDREVPSERATPPAPSPAGQVLPSRVDVETLVIEYAEAMAAGDLERAEEMAADIRKNMTAAEEIIQRITLDELPPERLAKIPRPVLVGFFKQLREK